MKKSKYFLSVFFVLAFHVAFCQKKNHAANQLPPVNLKAGIRLFAKSYGDSIVLRWGPTADWAWSTLNAVGYTIERIDLSEAKHPKKEILTQQALKPLSLAQMKTQFGPNNKYAAIAAQCLYGKNFSTNLRKGQAGQADKANVFNSRYAYSLQVADYDGNVAAAEGLRYTDKTVKRNGIYIYKIYPAKTPAQGKIDTANVLIENNETNIVRSKPQMTEAVSRDRLVELHWNRMQQEQYSGYFIERSDDGRHFTALNQSPYFTSKPDSSKAANDSTQKKIYELLSLQQVFVDSLPANYKKYYYRIRGINAFAELSNYSDTVTAMGTDLTPPAAPIVSSPKLLNGRKIQLTWKKPLLEKDFKGYVVTRAHLVSGPYIALNQGFLDPHATQFTDTSAFEHGQNFYIILVVDTAGNSSPSIPAMGLVPDHTPPAVPTGLKGSIDRNGLVHLSWNRNKDEDVKGYKVYFANSNVHVYSQITIAPDADTTFTDTITLKTLTKTIWYKIVAVDENNNHSGYSQPVELKKPDIIPPIPPLASKVYVDTSGVQIDWIQSSSEDVVSYIIYRKEKNSNWSVIKRMRHDSTKTLFHFTDHNLTPFHEYQYCAEAVDEDSLHSAKSTAVDAEVKTVPDLPAIQTLRANYNAKTKEVGLTWSFSAQGKYFFVLYRSANNEPLERFQSVLSNQSKYTDSIDPAKEQVVHYAIQALFQDQRGRTKVSRPVNVPVTQQ